MAAERVVWLSRHNLSPDQNAALKLIHGDDVAVEHINVTLQSDDGLALFIENRDEFVYAVAGAVHYLVAVEQGLEFGFFTNKPGRRENGEFSLGVVYHWGAGQLTRIELIG